MALAKLYNRIIFKNGTQPAINETNLNSMSKAIDDIDDRLIDFSVDASAAISANNTAQRYANLAVTYGNAAEQSKVSAEFARQASAANATKALESAQTAKESADVAVESSSKAEEIVRGASLTATHEKDGRVTTVSIKNASSGVVIDEFEVLDGEGGGGAEYLADMGDVDITEKEDGDALVYNSETHKWEGQKVASDIPKMTKEAWKELPNKEDYNGKTVIITNDLGLPSNVADVLQEEIEESNERIDSLNQAMATLSNKQTWKYFGEYSAEGSISGGFNLPSDFEEVMIVGNQVDIHVLKANLTNSAEYHQGGWYLTSSNNGGVAIGITKTQITYSVARVNGTEQRVTYKVYYR